MSERGSSDANLRPSSLAAEHNPRSAAADRLSPAPEAVIASRFYFPELDILRFLAFLSVFIFHLPAYRSNFYTRIGFVGSVCLIGGFGVDLFFALSAFLITRLLLNERRTTGGLDVRAFYLRRILRIWPLFFFFLGFSFVLSRTVHLFGDGALVSVLSINMDAEYFFALALLSGNFVGAIGNPIVAPLWSICAEEQFYLLWPLLVRRASRRAIVWSAVSMVVISFALRFTALLCGYSGATLGFWTITRLDPFGAGILLAVIPQTRWPDLGWKSRSALTSLGLVLWWVAANQCNTGLKVSLAVFLAAIGSAAFLTAAMGAGQGISRSTVKRGLIYFGKVSYGLYVWHELAIVISRDLMFRLVLGRLSLLLKSLPAGLALYALLSLCITFVCAACSYRWLESPFLRLKARYTYVSSRPV